MFKDSVVENDLLLGRTDAVVRETQVEDALSAAARHGERSEGA